MTACPPRLAFGYRYILPQVNRYRLCGSACCVRFSCVSVDLTRTPHALVSGEYTAGNIKGRLMRWPLEASTGKLQSKAGAVTSTGAYFHGVAAVQGGQHGRAASLRLLERRKVHSHWSLLA